MQRFVSWSRRCKGIANWTLIEKEKSTSRNLLAKRWIVPWVILLYSLKISWFHHVQVLDSSYHQHIVLGVHDISCVAGKNCSFIHCWLRHHRYPWFWVTRYRFLVSIIIKFMLSYCYHVAGHFGHRLHNFLCCVEGDFRTVLHRGMKSAYFFDCTTIAIKYIIIRYYISILWNFNLSS